MSKHSMSCVVVCSLLSATAAADTDGPTTAVTRPDPRVAITLSPIHLTIPVVELTAEVRLGHRVSVAVVAGAGQMRDMVTDAKISLAEGGASIRYYALGSFRTGLQLGAEALYLHASTNDATTTEVKARGLGIGPFVGVKWTHRTGLTFEGQGGVSILAVRGESETTTAEDSRVGPLLNLNVGYSF